MLFKLIYITLLVLFNVSYSEDLNFRKPITPSFYNGVIHLSDLNDSAAAGGAMYSVDVPGRYYVASNLDINPSNSRVAAIRVDSDNVYLNLNETTIYQRVGNSQTGLMGIEISSNLSNVQIMNGIVKGLNVADSTEENGGLVVRSGCNNINIENFKVYNCTSATNEVSGFLVSSSNNVKLKNCEASNNTNTLATSTDPDGVVSGFRLSSCNGCMLSDCYASRNTSADQHSFGFTLSVTKYTKLLNCVAMNQISNSGDASDISSGYLLEAGEGNLLDSCLAIGNQGGSHANSQAAGFWITSNEKYATVQNCLALANNGSTGDSVGFFVASGVSFCTLVNNLSLANTSGDNGYGFDDTNVSANNNLFAGNFAHANGANSTGGVDNYASQAQTSSDISTASYNSYTNLDASRSGYDNLEIT